MVDKLSQLFSGMFSDELDKMGYRNQVIVGMKLNNGEKLYGKAKTILIKEVETDDENIRMGLSFLGTLGEGDILCVQGSSTFAYFGELMTRVSTRQGVSGVIIGGLTRDSHYTREASLPIYALGYSPKDIKGRGRVQNVNTPITIQDITIRPGDFIFGDSDGVVVIPQDIHTELEKRLEEVLQNELNIKTDIRAGQTVDYILNAYKEF